MIRAARERKGGPGERPRTLAGRGPGHPPERSQGPGLEEKPQMGGQVLAPVHHGKC